MIYVFDIDQTICETKNGDYNKSRPIQKRIDKINQLHKDGHTIIFQTARGMGRSNNNVIWAYKRFYDFTRRQLDEWGVKYDDLFMGKPAGDFYVDDKGMRDDRFFK